MEKVLILKQKIIQNFKSANKENTQNNNESFFSNKYTNIIKGIAILLMLIHHIGLDPIMSELPSIPFFNKLFNQGKVCVSIFLILSGYGLYISSERKKANNIKELSIFSIKHLVKLMTNFLLIFIIVVSYGTISGKRPLTIYENNIGKNMLIDFLGLANLFVTPTYNATWWFMSLIIVLYIIFPIMKLVLKKSPILFTITIFYVTILRLIPLKHHILLINDYLIAFGLGMVFAEFKLFDKIRKLNKSKAEEIILTIVFFVFGIYLRWKVGINSILYDTLCAFSIIFFCNNILVHIKGVNYILEILGKNSANMFLIHTFIYSYFFMGFILKFKYLVIMYLVLIVISLSVSIIIELSKKSIKKLYRMSKNRLLLKGEQC